PHNCYFCTSAMMSGRHYRLREINDVINEIRLYKQKYNIEKIHFWDDNFFVNKSKVKELLNRLIEEFPNIEFETPSGSEINAIDEEMIDLLAKAGFKKLFLAVESSNEDIQNGLIDKSVNLCRIPYIVKKVQEAGLIAEGSFMVGFPGETKKQIDNTFELAKNLGFDRISISIVNPLPGTLLYKQCKRENLLYPDYDSKNIRWSAENIKLSVPRGYLSKRRRETWVEYMKNRIDINKYEKEKVNSFKQ
ncbi:radical SAM protein, partial [Candidatus Woesearchaeota archaeon]|nr:radical SAM protein [Candidatus Woesearchaeota archaeon]